MTNLTTQNHPPRLISFAAATATALLLGLGMPGITGWWPLLFIALVPLLSMVRHLPPMCSGCMGMFCGLLYNIILLYWIVIVLGRYGGLPPWISVPAMTLLALTVGSYLALFCLLLNLIVHRIGNGNNVTGWIVLIAPVIWVGIDFLGGILFTGFPWMDLGYGLYRQPLLIQAADLGGHHLITFCIVLINGLLTWLIERFRNPVSDKGGLVPVIAGCVLLICVGGYSIPRYQQISSAMTTAEQARVGVIQGNIDQGEKWSPGRKEQTVANYLSLSRQVVEKNVDLIVWPETALPFYPQQDSRLMSRVLNFTREHQTHLLTGSPFYALNPKKDGEKKGIDYFNSGLLFNDQGRLTGRYNKQHLVPFGEYVPLRNLLWFIKPLVEMVGDFTAGSSFKPLHAGKIKAGVLICFESIFPEIARREVVEGGNLLVNLTNDAWYGRSSAPHHSFAMSVLRAVENRRSLVRAANTGISGFVEPTGVIRKQSEIFMPAALAETVPLFTALTIFTRGGHWFGAICLIMILPLLLIGWKKRHPSCSG